MNIIGSVGHLELQSLLQEHKRLKIDGWSINLEGEEVWLTNPYGNDIAFFDHDPEGCERILRRMAREDQEERERGAL